MRNSVANEAEEIFKNYKGNCYQMMREGDLDRYKTFNVLKETENKWLTEMQSELCSDLISTTNNKLKAEYFSEYGSIVVLLKDSNGLLNMMGYLNKNISILDSNTIFRFINTILNAQKSFQNNKVISNIVSECLLILKNMLQKPLFISDDYKENGMFPDYLSLETINSNIKSTIRYWEKS